jgi:hypothetical protein
VLGGQVALGQDAQAEADSGRRVVCVVCKKRVSLRQKLDQTETKASHVP